MHYSSITILFNPKSTGPSQKKAERLARRLRKLGYQDELEVVATKREGHGEQLAYKYAKQAGNPLVISSSGDGGYHEVINGIMKATHEGSQVITGLLPSGNANDHHKALHTKDIFKQIKDGTTKKVDLLVIQGTINGKKWQRYAHSYLGFGITPEVSKELNKIDLTPAKEIRIALRSIANTKPFTIKQNNKKRQYSSVVISNVSRMAKFINLSKDSSIDDGKFEVFTIEPKPSKIFGTLVKSATGGVPHSKQTSQYSFTTTEKLYVQLDGEVYRLDANSEVAITIEKRVLSCVI